MIAHLVHSYGYYAVFALIALESLGIPLPGESALIAAALYAGTTHHFNNAALAAKIAVACRCAQEVRAMGHDPELEEMLRQAHR